MAFGATLTVTVNAVAKVLNRINQDNYGSEYYLRSTTDEYTVKIRHSKEAKVAGKTQNDRHNVAITHRVFAVAGVSPEVVREAYIVFRIPVDDNLTNAGYLTAGFVDFLDTAGVQADVLTWQN